MPRIGNDIVDLNLAKTQSNWQRKGFLEKQFTKFEQEEILNAENPFLKVWLFWSMKEAAYKCYSQEYKKRFFAPKKFSCKMTSNQNGIVKIEKNIYYLKLTTTSNYTYSVARNKNNLKMVSGVFFIDKKSSSTKIINAKLLTHFSEENQLKKNDVGIPYLYKNNKILPISISKTHHGNYGAFAFTLNNEY